MHSIRYSDPVSRRNAALLDNACDRKHRERYPESKIILGHSGLTEMYDSAIKAANKLKNIYLCLCAPRFPLQKIIDSVSPDRILFGSAADSARISWICSSGWKPLIT
jgi:hypothetical protein